MKFAPIWVCCKHKEIINVENDINDPGQNMHDYTK